MGSHTPSIPDPNGLLPASGAWQPGDDPGRRQFASLFADSPLQLEAGGSLAPLVVAYETWGRLNHERSNAVLVLHALSGDSHASGPAGPGHLQAGWWDGLVGPGKAIDTDRWFVVCPNVLGGCQGTTGPSSLDPRGRRYGSSFPRVTIRDQVRVEAALADELEVARWAAVIGGSMGGMRVVEWIVTFPDRVRSAIAIATGAAASAEEIALCRIQNDTIRLDPNFQGGDYYEAPAGFGPHSGLGLARRLGQVSYRSEDELQERFGRMFQAGEDPLGGGRYAIESYLDHHADKLARRFDANSYILLSEAMNHHDVGRGRGGMGAALGLATADVTVIGIDSDRLYPLRLQKELAACLPSKPDVEVVTSAHGHDGFLLEFDQVGKIVAGVLGSRSHS